MCKIIIFGCGSGAEKVINALNDNVNIIAFADNDVKKQNTFYKGVKVVNPNDIIKYEYDFIIIGSQYNIAINEQLLQLKIEEGKIFDFYNYICNSNIISLNIKYFEEEISTYEAIITGISYTASGVEASLCKKKAYSFAYASQDIYYDYNIVKYLLTKYKNEMSNLKYVLIGLSYYSFEYDMSLSSMKNRVLLYYDAINLKHNLRNSISLKRNYTYDEKVIKKLFKVYKNNEIIIQWEKRGDITKILDNDIDKVGKMQAELDCNKNYPKTVKENIGLMKAYLDMLEKNNIKPIIIVSPASKYYTKYFSKRIEDEFHLIINNLRKEYKFQYVDYFRSEQFEEADFLDVSHLSSVGARKFTEILNNEIEW